MKIVYSVDKVPIRLSLERWRHICSRHPEMEGQKDKVMETISSPQFIQKGDFGEKISIKFYHETPITKKYLVIVYKEISPEDGFVLTAYFTRKPAEWRAEWRNVLWRL